MYQINLRVYQPDGSIAIYPNNYAKSRKARTQAVLHIAEPLVSSLDEFGACVERIGLRKWCERQNRENDMFKTYVYIVDYGTIPRFEIEVKKIS